MKLWVARDIGGIAGDRPFQEYVGVFKDFKPCFDALSNEWRGNHVYCPHPNNTIIVVIMALQFVRHQHSRELQPGECVEIEVEE